MEVRFVGLRESNEMVVRFLLRLIDRELNFIRVTAVNPGISIRAAHRGGPD